MNGTRRLRRCVSLLAQAEDLLLGAAWLAYGFHWHAAPRAAFQLTRGRRRIDSSPCRHPASPIRLPSTSGGRPACSVVEVLAHRPRETRQVRLRGGERVVVRDQEGLHRKPRYVFGQQVRIAGGAHARWRSRSSAPPCWPYGSGRIFSNLISCARFGLHVGQQLGRLPRDRRSPRRASCRVMSCTSASSLLRNVVATVGHRLVEHHAGRASWPTSRCRCSAGRR